jgi:hypothetical protein
LQFSHPVTNTISTWPSQSAEIHRKLKKAQKGLPSFGWDTDPVLGSEEVIEEAFLDVFCDLIYGGGWMDVERYEEIDRDCNWALVCFFPKLLFLFILLLILGIFAGGVQVDASFKISFYFRYVGSEDSDDTHAI